MKSELLAKSPLLALPLVALFLFLAVFVGAILLTMKRGSGGYASLERLPFDDESRDDVGETP